MPKATIEVLRQMRPEEFVMRERLAAEIKSGNKDRLPWWQAGVNRVLSKGTDTDPTYSFVISSSRVDRMGDIVRPDGMDNKSFRTNPVVLYNHDDLRNLPIGVSTMERIVKGKHVEADAIFDLDNDPSGMAAAVKGKLDKGHLTATSIRFAPSDYEMIYESVETEHGETQQWTGGFDFKSWELLEWSVVSIPANPDCVRRAYGILTEGVKSDQDEVIASLVGKLVKAEMEPFLAQLAELKAQVTKFEATGNAEEFASQVAQELSIHRSLQILREIEPVTVGG